jgi:hypothetical protein
MDLVIPAYVRTTPDGRAGGPPFRPQEFLDSIVDHPGRCRLGFDRTTINRAGTNPVAAPSESLTPRERTYANFRIGPGIGIVGAARSPNPVWRRIPVSSWRASINSTAHLSSIVRNRSWIEPHGCCVCHAAPVGSLGCPRVGHDHLRLLARWSVYSGISYWAATACKAWSGNWS